jgi:hypothetical protein
MRFMTRAAVAIVMTLIALPSFAARALIDYDAGQPRIEFAVGDLETALRHRRFQTERHDLRQAGDGKFDQDVVVRIRVSGHVDPARPTTIEPEGFVIRSV